MAVPASRSHLIQEAIAVLVAAVAQVVAAQAVADGTSDSAKERIDSELRIARDIQMSMVPSIFPAFPNRRDIDLHASISPASSWMVIRRNSVIMS